MKQATAKYYKGTIPIPDTTWIVETVDYKTSTFRVAGEVFVSGKVVAEAMNAAKNIKDNMPECIAKRLAHKKFPNINPIIVSRKYEDE